MWDWAHFKEDGWINHTKKSSKLAALLLVSGLAMILHMLVPFWQQPKQLQSKCVGCVLCDCECCRQENNSE